MLPLYRRRSTTSVIRIGRHNPGLAATVPTPLSTLPRRRSLVAATAAPRFIAQARRYRRFFQQPPQAYKAGRGADFRGFSTRNTAPGPLHLRCWLPSPRTVVLLYSGVAKHGHGIADFIDTRATVAALPTTGTLPEQGGDIATVTLSLAQIGHTVPTPRRFCQALLSYPANPGHPQAFCDAADRVAGSVTRPPAVAPTIGRLQVCPGCGRCAQPARYRRRCRHRVGDQWRLVVPGWCQVGAPPPVPPPPQHRRQRQRPKSTTVMPARRCCRPPSVSATARASAVLAFQTRLEFS